MRKYAYSALSAAVLAACALTLCGCEEGSKEYRDADAAYSYEYEMPEAEFVSDDAGFYEQKAAAYGSAEAPAEENAGMTEEGAVARKIIYSCSYTVQTKDFEETVSRLEALVAKYGAYNESADIYDNDSYGRSADIYGVGGGRSANYVIRVPAGKYEAFRAEAGNIGTVVRASENNRDVSESYFDIEARLASARLHEERLLAILEKSESLDDVLLLESNLSDVRYEIETLTGSLKKYDSLIDYATVEVAIEEVIKVTKVEETPKNFAERVWQACKGSVSAFGDGMENVLIALIYALPALLLLGVIVLVIVLIVRACIRKRKNGEKAQTDKKE